MNWVKIKRTSFTSRDPVIYLHHNRFSYSVISYRVAELSKYSFVTYYINPENRKIGFEFTNDEGPDSFKLVKSESKGHYSTSTELFSIPWIKKVSREKSLNGFRPVQEGKKWVITLIPAFEYSVSRNDSLKIKAEAKGIYRYLSDGEIVYIGKGNIRDRFNEPQRKEWKFDTVEYSIIEDQEEQFEWESFWIERFKHDNESSLPIYNLISGKRI